MSMSALQGVIIAMYKQFASTLMARLIVFVMEVGLATVGAAQVSFLQHRSCLSMVSDIALSQVFTTVHKIP